MKALSSWMDRFCRVIRLINKTNQKQLLEVLTNGIHS